jgi:hypothetical protein
MNILNYNKKIIIFITLIIIFLKLILRIKIKIIIFFMWILWIIRKIIIFITQIIIFFIWILWIIFFNLLKNGFFSIVIIVIFKIY